MFGIVCAIAGTCLACGIGLFAFHAQLGAPIPFAALASVAGTATGLAGVLCWRALGVPVSLPTWSRRTHGATAQIARAPRSSDRRTAPRAEVVRLAVWRERRVDRSAA